MTKSAIILGSNVAIVSGTFASPVGHIGTGGGAAAEVDAQYAISHACTFSAMRRRITTGGSGSNVLRLRKNTANANLVCTGTGTGLVEDLVNTDTFVAGDVISLAPTDDGTDPLYRYVTTNVEFTTGHGCFHAAALYSGSGIFDVASTTRYIPIHGELSTDGNTSEAAVQWKIRGYNKVDAFQFRVMSNARTTDTIITLRLNGADVTGTAVTVEPSQTGLFLVTGINQALSSGDLLCASITTGTGVEDLVLTLVGVTLMATTPASELWCARQQGSSRTASGTESCYVLGGGMSASAIANHSIIPGFAATVSNLRCYLSANTYTSDATLTLYKNEVAVVTQTLTAAGTGWFENTINTVNIDHDDSLIVSIVGGTANSITIQSIGVTLTNLSQAVPVVGHYSSGGGLGVGPRLRWFPHPSISIIRTE